jgi:hypothetical protein
MVRLHILMLSMNNHPCHCDIPVIITLSQHDKDSRVCDNCDTLLEECHSITTDVPDLNMHFQITEALAK